jgi:spermidine/putrescine-binding protein
MSAVPSQTIFRFTSGLLFVAAVVISVVALLSGCSRLPVKQPDSSAGADFDDIPAGKQTLSILTWADYFIPELLEEFERTHGTKIELTEVENSEQLIQTLSADPSQFDVVVADDKSIEALSGLNLIGELGSDGVPGLVNIADEFKGLYFDPLNRFSVPYLWGTTVIAYRKSDLPVDLPKSWNLLWDDSLKGRVGILDEPEDMFFIALLALGGAPEKAGPIQIAAAKDRLMDGFLRMGGRMRDFRAGLDHLQSGRLSVAITYSGDAALRSIQDPEIQFIVPAEGAPMWLDSFALSRDADQGVLARQFIDFMVSPSVAAASANGLQCASPNAAARPMIDQALLSNPGLYPSPDVLKTCRFIRFDEASQLAVRQGVRELIEALRSMGIDPDASNEVAEAKTCALKVDRHPVGEAFFR